MVMLPNIEIIQPIGRLLFDVQSSFRSKHYTLFCCLYQDIYEVFLSFYTGVTLA